LPTTQKRYNGARSLFEVQVSLHSNQWSGSKSLRYLTINIYNIRIYVHRGIDPVAGAYDIKTLEYFVHKLVHRIEGGYDNPKPDYKSVDMV
jgi:hypothetical protein